MQNIVWKKTHSDLIFVDFQKIILHLPTVFLTTVTEVAVTQKLDELLMTYKQTSSK